MKNSFQKKPGSVIELDVEMTLPEFNEYWQPVFDAAQAKVQIKGFRPGQAPPQLAKKAVDTEKVFQEASQDAVRRTLTALAEENKWTIIDQPQITIKDDDNSFSYHARLVIFPEIKLADYKAIARRQKAKLDEEIKAVTVSEREINETIGWLKKNQANLSKFKDEAAMQQSVKEGIKMEKEGREKEKALLLILDEVAEKSEIDAPQVMIDKVGSRDKVLRQLVIYKIAETEKLQPAAGEVESEAGKWPPGKIDKDQLYSYLYEQIQQRKVYDKLLNPDGN